MQNPKLLKKQLISEILMIMLQKSLQEMELQTEEMHQEQDGGQAERINTLKKF